MPHYALEHELIDQDYLKLRLDPCCHYNAEGHRTLVGVMARIILEQLGDSRQTASVPPARAEAR